MNPLREYESRNFRCWWCGRSVDGLPHCTSVDQPEIRGWLAAIPMQQEAP